MRKNERGIALIIVLFATLLLTVIGLGMMYSTNMETAINGNYRESQVALYAALAGLQQGRERLKYPYDSAFNPPDQLPSTTEQNVVYIVSDASLVKPWDPDNAYFDTELCHTNVLDLTGTIGVPCTETADGDDWYKAVDNSGSSTWNLASTLPALKWIRIQLKGNNSTPVAVNGVATDASQACWDGTHQISTPTGYTTGCQPVGGVNAITVDAAGTGYTSTPTITLSGGGGTGATATAHTVAETTGKVTAITVDTGGAYASTPAVTVSGNATATATLSSTGTTVNIGGTVTGATLVTPGSGFTAAPTVTISGGGGSGATAVANLSTSGAVAITGGTVTSASVTTGGAGYSSAPTVTLTGGGGSGATATANMIDDGSGGVITGGAVTATTLTAGGSGYTSAPTVTFAGGGGGTGASATAVLSSTGTSVATGNVTGISVGSGGSGYTSAPTVTLSGGSGTGATATATLATTGSIKSIDLSSAGTQCYTNAADVVVTINGNGTGAAASANLESSYSCVRSVSTAASVNCTNKLQTGQPGTVGTYAVSGQQTSVTFSVGNYSATGTFLTSSNNKTPASWTPVNPGYDTSAYNAAPLATNPYLKLSGGAAWADCGNTQVVVNAGKRVASFTITNAGSGYTTATVAVTGGGGSTSYPTATATIGYAVTGVTVTSGGTGYATQPTVAFSGGGGGTGATGTASIFTSSSTTYSVAAINLVSGGSGYVSVPTLTLSGGGGSGATGTAAITTTGTSLYKVSTITITGGGSGYTSTPTVGFTGGGSGAGAVATATVTNTTQTTYPVESVTITAAGSGYTSTPTITLAGGSGTGATATANVTFITSTTYPVSSVTVTSQGTGYTAVPTVTFTGGGGTGGGTATATIADVATGTYALDHITVDTEGSGYSSNPTVTFSVSGGSGAAATSQISGGTRFGKVWLVTALAVTSTGARSMVQAEVSSPILGFGSGGALTLDGPSPSIDAMPNSNNFVIRGNDANSCGETAEAVHPAIDGFDDPNANPPTHSVEDIIDALPAGRLDHYTGAGGTPSVQNGYGALGETMSTPGGMDSVMSAIYNTPGAHHYTAANLSSFNEGATTDSSINYIDGDADIGSGRGILVVTGTLTMHGNFSWHGIIFVVGDGIAHFSGGGNGQIVGSIWVAKTWNNHTDKNLLSSLGSPTFHWNGGGGNGIQYDHCYVSKLLTAVPTSGFHSSRPLKALSYRALQY